MNILLIHRYFWPDTPPYANMVRFYGEAWGKNGHKVSVFSTQPSYKKDYENQSQANLESLKGIEVYRCRLLSNESRIPMKETLNAVAFVLQAAFFILRSRRFDFVVMSTVPQVIGALFVSIACKVRKFKFIYHLQDIHPEGAEIIGLLKNKPLVKILYWFDKITCYLAYKIVVLSTDMKQTIASRSSNFIAKTSVIKNPTVTSFNSRNESLPEISTLLKKSGVFRIIFAGNIGRWQNLDAILSAAGATIKYENIEWVLLGDGKYKSKLERRVIKEQLTNVRFFDHQPVEIADCVVKDADLALITLAPELYKAAFPSKLMTYCKLGIPPVVVMENSSEMVRIVKEWDCGFCADIYESKELESVVLKAYNSPKMITEKSENLKNMYASIFNETKILSDWDQIFKNSFIDDVVS